MKRFTPNVRQLLLTAVASLLGLSANAQYTKTVTQYPNSSYEAVQASFKLTEVAQTLGTDTTTLVNALKTWYETNTAEGATPSGDAMFQAYVDDALVPGDASAYNGNFNGIWFGKDGSLQPYGENAAYHAESAWDATEDAFSIYLLQYPNAFAGGESNTKKFALTFGGKTATFDITYNINTPAEVPAPATLLRSEFAEKMTKAGEATVKAVRTDVQGYEATALKVNAKEIAEKLGIEYEKFATMDMSKLIYTINYDTYNNGIASDTLTNAYTANAPGFWFRTTIYGQGEEHQGEDSPVLGAAAYGDTDKIFIEQFKIAGDSITCNLGQFPGKLIAGDDLTAYIYIMYGDKYYLVNYNVKCEAAATTSISEMENTGNVDVELEFNQFTGDYGVVYTELDLEAIKTALGITDDSAIQFKVAKDDDAFYPGNTDAGAYGYWMDGESHKTSWKDGETSPLFVTLEKQGEPGKIGVGLFAGLHQKAGTSHTTKVYYVAGSKYFTITIKCNVVEKEQKDHSTWNIVATKKVAKQVIASTDVYISDNNQTSFTITAEECQQLVGTASPTLYCELADTLQKDGKLYAPYSVYACDPKPGVWLGKNGQGHLWSGNADCPVGICWLQSTTNGLPVGDFAVFQVPNVNKAGDVYKAKVYLVNEETYDMVQVDFNITFVSAIESAETVGTENMTIASSKDEDKHFTIDLTKAAEALGVTAEELLNDESGYFKIMTASGTFTNVNVTPSSGYTFDKDGSYNAGGDGAFGIGYNADNAEWDVYGVSASTAIEEDTWKIATTFCFEVNGKQYLFNITVVDENTYTGIEDVKAADSNKQNKIYNLQGIEITKPVKGQIYIQNGKKRIF